ncbi:hypothetical protein CEXT_398451 [Caerostris extrusa]|uniref:Uncharacterized protein n=1 Tax=Caerostris extrusa TaxID=172846 RepID=A0AAV4RN67_CAEEX|nr:hypothetical protein CEXT_398451 [Caerostris extrusa]
MTGAGPDEVTGMEAHSTSIRMRPGQCNRGSATREGSPKALLRGCRPASLRTVIITTLDKHVPSGLWHAIKANCEHMPLRVC